MPLKIVMMMDTIMAEAKRIGQLRLDGFEEEADKAAQAQQELIKITDEICLGMTWGELP